MASNRLQLNAAKSEVLWCASNRQQHLVPSDPFSVCGDLLPSLHSLFASWAYFWTATCPWRLMCCELYPAALQLCDRYAASVVPSVSQFYSLSLSLSLSLVTSLVLSSLDYDSVNLIGISRRLQDRLQSMLNAAARLVCNGWKYDHITPLLRDLAALAAHPRTTDF